MSVPGSQAERDAVVVKDEEHVAQYYAAQRQLVAARAEVRAIVCAPRYALPFLQPGRLVRVLAAPPAGEGAPVRVHHRAVT